MDFNKVPTSPIREWIIFFVIMVMVFAFKLPVLRTPYYWDELVYFEPSYWLSKASLTAVLPGLHPPAVFFGHPPGLFVIVAILLKLFSDSIWIAHGVSILFGFLGIYFTYLLGSFVYNRSVGLLAGALLFFTPLYFAQSGMFLGDIPVASVGVMTVYFYLRQNNISYVISGCSLVMLKETGIAIIAAILLYQYLTERHQRDRIIKLVTTAIPLVPAGVFFVAQKLTTGSFLPNPVLQENSFALSLFSPLLLLLKVLQVNYWLFIAQFRFIISIFIAIAYIKYRSEVELKEILLFKIMVLFFIIPFIVIFFMARYILPILPFFYIIGAASITSIFNNRNVRLSIAAACIVSFSLLLTGKSKEYRNYEVNMQYIDIVNIYREAGKHLEDRAMTGKVFAPWPLDEIYCKPHLGYVTKPVSMAQDVFDADILIYSRHSDYHASRYLEQVISLNHLKPCRKIEQKGKLIELYCLNDDDKKNIMKNKVFYHAEAPSPALPMTNYLIKIRDYFGE